MSRTFTDIAGRPWSLTIDAPNLKRVRAALGCCPLDILKPGKVDEWLDPVRVVDTLYVLVKPQADAAGVTDEDFGRALVGDPKVAGEAALLDAVIDYLPSAKGTAFREAYSRLTAAADAALATVCRAIADAAEPAAATPTA